jgi:hypothetical protein
VKASSRCKQLQRYKGNWATLEIMKTLLKNRRTYKHRIGSIDEHIVKNEEVEVEEVEVDHNGDDDEGSDDMYMEDEKNYLGSDENGNGEDKGENGGSDGGDDEDGSGAIINGSEDGGDDDDGNGTKINGSEDGRDDEDGNGTKINGSEDGGEDKERKAINSSRGLPGGKANGGSTKRKLKVTQDDEPSARVKRTKKDGSGGHQGGTQLTKKVMPKRQSGKKKF